MPFWVRVHTLCLYRGIYFLCISLYCVPRSQWRKLLHWRMKPCSHTTLEVPLQKHIVRGPGPWVEERQVQGLCPSQLHWLLHPRGICSLSVSSYRLHCLRKPVTLVPYSSVINRCIFVAACPDQVYKGVLEKVLKWQARFVDMRGERGVAGWAKGDKSEQTSAVDLKKGMCGI